MTLECEQAYSFFLSMIINCYYYAPHNHTLLGEHMEKDFERMKALGTDVVSFCVQESQLSNWHQQRLRNAVDLAHECGLRVHAVPNRWAGLVAGWLDGFGKFTLEHADTLIRTERDNPMARSEMVSCVNRPEVAAHVEESLRVLFERFEFDGLIWDEPHAAACYCPRCRELAGEAGPSERWYHERFAEFIDGMSAQIKRWKPGAVVSVFVQPFQRMMLKTFLDKTSIDYLGSDGHVRDPRHEMHRMKRTIFEAYEEFQPLLEEAGKPSFYLLEGQRHRDEDLDNYLENLERAFSLPMDHLMYYYSAHEMSLKNEQRFNEATWEQVARVSRLRAKASAAEEV